MRQNPDQELDTALEDLTSHRPRSVRDQRVRARLDRPRRSHDVR